MAEGVGHDHIEAVGPRTARTSIFRMQAGLSTQFEIHDKQQLEIRFSYSLRGTGAERYTVDTFFFFPRNIGVGPSTYSKSQFYQDVTPLMRLDADPIPLERLADPKDQASPLSRVHAALDQFRTSRRPPDSSSLMVHIKLYAYLFTVGVRSELRRLLRQVRASAGESSERRRRFRDEDLPEALGRIRRALWAYRSCRGALWPFERMAHRSLREALRSSDEYMSLFLEERLANFLDALRAVPAALDGEAFVTACRLQLVRLARDESNYRRTYGYATLSERSLTQGEYFTYRASLLKKTVQQALYLAPRSLAQDRFAANAAAVVGAALAAIWALATQLPQTITDLPWSTKFWFFGGAVVAYVLKDRIKAYVGTRLAGQMRRYDHVSALTGESLKPVGLSVLRARLREVMRFIRSHEVPPEFLGLRLDGRTVHGAERPDEEVIHYRKVIDVSTSSEHERLQEGYWVRDSMRLNVRHFLVRLDDPLDTVSYFDPSRATFETAQLPKVYHMNVVARIVRESAGTPVVERLERWRVVLDKGGIVRVDSGKARTIRHDAPSAN